MSLANALFPKTRQLVLGILYSAPERELYLREIARLSGVTVSSIQRELDQLAKAGILCEARRGNQRVFRANPDCPLHDELAGFARKTYAATVAELETHLREGRNGLADARLPGISDIFDGRDFLKNQGPLLDALRVETFFTRFFIDAGALCWPNGLELSPAKLHETCVIETA